MKLYLGTFLFVSCLSACSKSNSTTTQNATDAKTVQTLAINPLNLTQKSDAATPTGFKAGASLSLADASDICDTKFPRVNDVRNSSYYACLGGFDVRKRFFQAGPTVIRDRLESVDSRLNEYLARTQSVKIPCLDPANTGGTDKVFQGAGKESIEQEYSAYNLKTFGSSTTFSDAYTLDLGRSYSFSCWDQFGDSSTALFDVYLGRRSDTWYLGELQTPGTQGTSPKIVNLFSVDADDNMEVLFAIAPKKLANNSDANPEGLSTTAVENLYSESAGFAQFIVRPKEGIYGAVAIMNYACEQRLVMNDTAAYVEVNGNNYGRCFANDIWVGNSSVAGPAFNSAITNSKVCLKVSGSLPEPQEDLSLCESSGLLISDENGGYLDPFEKYGIMKLSTNTATPPTGGFALRAYHAARIVPQIGAGTNKLQQVEFPPDAVVTVDSYAAASFAFSKAKTSVNSDAATVSAACNAAESDRKVTFTQVFDFALADYVSSMKAAAPEGTASDELVTGLNASLANTGDAAPVVKTRLSRRVGTSFQSVGAGTVTLKYDGALVGSSTVDQTSLAKAKFYTDITIPLTSIPAVAATGKFTVEYAGTTLLACDNSNALVRKANSILGNPSFVIYSKPAEQ